MRSRPSTLRIVWSWFLETMVIKYFKYNPFGRRCGTFKDDISGHCFRKWAPKLHLLVASRATTPTSRIIGLNLPIYFRSFIGAPFQPTYHHHRGPPCRRWSHHSRFYSAQKKTHPATNSKFPSPRDPGSPKLRMVMEPKYLAEEVIIHPNHHLTGDWIPRVLKIGDPESKFAVSTNSQIVHVRMIYLHFHGEKVATWTRGKCKEANIPHIMEHLRLISGLSARAHLVTLWASIMFSCPWFEPTHRKNMRKSNWVKSSPI